MLEVVESTGLVTIQDLGRPGHAHLGVPPSGALDPEALKVANRLVGNPENAAGIEILGRLRIRAERYTTVATTGPASVVHVREIAVNAERVRYLAVAGGIAVEPVLGSRSTDTLSGLGPQPLKAGDVLPLGAHNTPSIVDWVPEPAPPGELELGITFGPRDDLFADAAALLRWAYHIKGGDRVGTRLDGPSLSRADLRDSEPVVTGAIQVPPDGKPLVFLNDHPTTGGYPVIAVVDGVDVPRLAQARPGTPVRFRRSPRRAA
jgi:allophanate hydrolase subunit 2